MRYTGKGMPKCQQKNNKQVCNQYIGRVLNPKKHKNLQYVKERNLN